MLRIKSDSLILRASKYWYQDQPFDGIAYMVIDSTIHAMRMIDGETAGEYASPYFGDVFSNVSIDITGFNEDDIDEEGEVTNGAGLSYVRTRMGFKLSRDGTPFTGLAYVFFGEFCVREIGYKDGIAVSDAKWYHDGQLLALLFENEADECYTWYPDGTREIAWISVVKTYPDRSAERLLHLALAFASSGEITSLAAVGDGDALENLIATHPFFPVRKLSELGNLTAAKRCVFADDAWPFELFEDLVHRNAFRSTVELHLPSTFLNRMEGIELVGSLRALSKVSLSSKRGNELEVARKLKNRRPDLEIEVPREIADDPGYYDYVDVDLY